MRSSGLRLPGIVAIVFNVVVLLSAIEPPHQSKGTFVAPPNIVLTFNPGQSRVHFTVDSTLHTVHGTFAVKSGTLNFDPETGKAGGEIIVSALSGESGNASRDKRMHNEILETAKYPDIIFHPTQVEGAVAPAGASDVKLHGVFSVHGANHDLTGLVHAELTGDHWHGSCKFDVPYVKWGIKDPSNFFLKVKPVVNVELEMSGDIHQAK
jgi:polyisoprenoid-binding protein YceI